MSSEVARFITPQSIIVVARVRAGNQYMPACQLCAAAHLTAALCPGRHHRPHGDIMRRHGGALRQRARLALHLPGECLHDVPPRRSCTACWQLLRHHGQVLWRRLQVQQRRHRPAAAEWARPDLQHTTRTLSASMPPPPPPPPWLLRCACHRDIRTQLTSLCIACCARRQTDRDGRAGGRTDGRTW
jgi:hypothetical protein